MKIRFLTFKSQNSLSVSNTLKPVYSIRKQPNWIAGFFIGGLFCSGLCLTPSHALADETPLSKNTTEKVNEGKVSIETNSKIKIKSEFSHALQSNQRQTNRLISEKEMQWIGQGIYANECASKPENLVHWNKGENFPSLGIGHFIWYRSNQKEKFIETFPTMVKFVAQQYPPPKWLTDLPNMNAPWENQAAFLSFKNTPEYQALLDWLIRSQPMQAEFISQQLINRFNTFVNQQSLTQENQVQQHNIERLFNNMMSFKKGRFALIDYVNFKGIGAKSEAYQGEQWGLISVFEDMLLRHPQIYQWQDVPLLQEFVSSAKNRLQKRVALSPAERQEHRWLKGWFIRLDGYLID